MLSSRQRPCLGLHWRALRRWHGAGAVFAFYQVITLLCKKAKQWLRRQRRRYARGKRRNRDITAAVNGAG